MYFEYQTHMGLPVLAWALRASRADERILVWHGAKVETTPDFFVEGAWLGPFAAGKLDQSDVLLGSGARLADGKLIVASATHSLERLHSLRAADTLYVSNSLAFLLAVSGDDLLESHRAYDIDLLSFVDGLPGAATSLPTRNGSVRLHYCSNLIIDRNLAVREEGKPDFSTRPVAFAEYLDFLQALSSEISDNAAALERTHRYTALATVSSGYDSPACAILARDAGADTALTFSRSRSGFDELDDSGTRIGEKLGLEVLEFARTSYMNRSDMPEAEFLASGTGGEDVVLSALEPVLPGTLLYTGYRGDAIWGLGGKPAQSSRYRMKDPSGASLSEFRLRVGFIHFPIPQTHHRMHRYLHALSHADEMAPWRRGGSYDRPIPRRIIEAEGVPGDWFGRTKKAITQPFYHGDPLDQILSAATREELRDYCLRHRLPDPTQHRSVLLPLYRFANDVTWHLPRFRASAWRVIRKVWLNPGAFATTWAIQHLRLKYAKALTAEPT